MQIFSQLFSKYFSSFSDRCPSPAIITFPPIYLELSGKLRIFANGLLNIYKTMAATVLNDAQLELLRMMSVFDTPEAVTDLKQAISNYFAQKAEEEIDKLWENGTLSEAKIESFRS